MNAVNPRILLQIVVCLGLLGAMYASSMAHSILQGRVVAVDGRRVLVLVNRTENWVFAPASASVTVEGRAIPLTALKPHHLVRIAARRADGDWVASSIAVHAPTSWQSASQGIVPPWTERWQAVVHTEPLRQDAPRGDEEPRIVTHDFGELSRLK